MNKTFAVYLIFLIPVLFFHQAVASPVDEPMALKVAGNFLGHLGLDASLHQIDSIDTIDDAEEHVAFVISLSPQGYILVAGDTIRVPVKAYSLQTTYTSLPAPYRDTLLTELSLPRVEKVATSSLKSAASPEATNSTFWDYLTSTTPLRMEKTYIPETHLLTTYWDQGFPYNSFNPQVGNQQTVTGCTQTAIAQVMRYHKHPAHGSGVFTHNWQSQELTAIVNRPFNWDILTDSPHKSSSRWEHEEIASLMLDLGILNEATFGIDGTSAYFHTEPFQRAFGYAPIYSMHISESAFFETIRNEIDNLRPVLLSIPRHMTVADGYASDPTGKKIHVNMGWAGAHDDYYFLDQTIIAGDDSFQPDNTIYYNIKPCIDDECLPSYPPEGGNKPPEFIHPLSNAAINSSEQVRLDSRDPDGDTVHLSAFSTCASGKLPINVNLLPLDPTSEEQFCQLTVFSTSQDGTAADTFKVLTGPAGTYRGEQFDIGGQFPDGSTVHEYRAFLSGTTTISGTRGYSNQAFYIWVKDPSGATIAGPDDSPVTALFSPGYYTITVSLKSPSGWYYTYDPEYSEYLLSISIGSTIEEIAGSLGLSLPQCQFAIDTSGDGIGVVESLPGGIDCGLNCSTSLACNSEIQLSTLADTESIFTRWGGACAGTATTLMHRVEDTSTCVAIFERDADQDKMPDSWESQYGLDTTINDAHEDKDGDGIDNLSEYRNGTPPIVLHGDVNGDDTIAIEDAVLALKVATGESPDGIKKEADVNNDNLLGIAEAVSILKEVSKQ